MRTEACTMLHVIAIVTAIPGRRDTLLAAFLDNVPNVRSEDGCLEYVATVDADFGPMQTPLGPDSFAVVEKWTTADALRAHGAAAHMAAYRAASGHLIANSDVYVLDVA